MAPGHGIPEDPLGPVTPVVPVIPPPLKRAVEPDTPVTEQASLPPAAVVNEPTPTAAGGLTPNIGSPAAPSGTPAGPTDVP